MENKKGVVDNASEEKEITVKIADLLRNQVKPTQSNQTIDSSSKNSKEKETAEIIKNANQKFLIEVLSPEIRDNESKKRQHKDALMNAVSKFLLFQFIIVAGMVVSLLGAFIWGHMIGKPFANDTMQIFLSFVGIYITSVVVELIAILRCIVTNVFDTSIAGLVEAFREK